MATAQLEELHLGAVKERVEADLILGQARELMAERAISLRAIRCGSGCAAS